MRLSTIVVLVFLLSAFAIGSILSDPSSSVTPQNISDTLSATNITDITLDRIVESDDSFISVNRIITVIEAFIRFALVGFIELMQMGIEFGYDNLNYFEASFIISIVRLIVILVIISLLIKPLFYLIILNALSVIWIVEKFKKKNDKKITNTNK